MSGDKRIRRAKKQNERVAKRCIIGADQRKGKRAPLSDSGLEKKNYLIEYESVLDVRTVWAGRVLYTGVGSGNDEKGYPNLQGMLVANRTHVTFSRFDIEYNSTYDKWVRKREKEFGIVESRRCLCHHPSFVVAFV